MLFHVCFQWRIGPECIDVEPCARPTRSIELRYERTSDDDAFSGVGAARV